MQTVAHKALSQEVAQHGARLDDAEHRNELLRAEMAELRKQMSVVEKTELTQRDARDEGWERDSDLRLVIAGKQNAVTRAPHDRTTQALQRALSGA